MVLSPGSGAFAPHALADASLPPSAAALEALVASLLLQPASADVKTDMTAHMETKNGTRCIVVTSKTEDRIRD
jgi:hypothetical protein